MNNLLWQKRWQILINDEILIQYKLSDEVELIDTGSSFAKRKGKLTSIKENQIISK